MRQENVTSIICIVGLFGLLFGMILIAYEDGVPMGLYKRLRCKFGWHKRQTWKVKKYYCQFCKKPREHPVLKLIDCGDKMRNNEYKF